VEYWVDESVLEDTARYSCCEFARTTELNNAYLDSCYGCLNIPSGLLRRSRYKAHESFRSVLAFLVKDCFADAGVGRAY